MTQRLLMLVCCLATGMLRAQIGPLPAATLSLTKTNQQTIVIPAANPSTLINVSVDQPANGQDSIDVLTSDPNVVITLLLPNGTEITANNASSNGFIFTGYYSDGSVSSEAGLSPFLTAGTHTVIDFPAGTPSGVYSVKANASASQSDSAMTIIYYPSSTVALAAATDASTYVQGDLVILSGLLFDGQTPIQNASLTAIAGTFLPVSGTVSNYQLASTTQLDSTFSLYTYSVQFTNSGTATNNVFGTVVASDPNMALVTDAVGFGSVAAGGTVTGSATFSFTYPTASQYDLSSLQWTVVAPDAPVNVTLADSGSYDAVAGDGIYTGTFTPSDLGDYVVMVTATGTSTSGLQFVRTASTSPTCNRTDRSIWIVL
jgi:hypothetical protein